MKIQVGECRQSTAVILEFLGVPSIAVAIMNFGEAYLYSLGWDGSY